MLTTQKTVTAVDIIVVFPTRMSEDIHIDQCCKCLALQETRGNTRIIFVDTYVTAEIISRALLPKDSEILDLLQLHITFTCCKVY